MNAATTANDPTYFRISGLSNPTLSVTGQRNTNGPVLPGGSTDYRGGISGIQIVPNADATATLMINRDTGEISLNGMGGTYEFAGYTMTSELGTLSEDAWVSIAGNYDSMGDGSVSSDAWNIFSATSQELSEGTLGQGAVDATVPISLGEGTWRKYFDEDVQMQVLDLNGNVNVLQVTYTGNGGQPFAFGDLNFDGAIDALDWPTVRDNFNAALSDLSSVDNYYAGDLTEDGQVDLDDLLAFETLYDAENGAGSFARLVPEPSSWTLLLFGSLAFWRRKPNRRPL